MKVSWTHILLDPNVFARYGTHRVARIPRYNSAFPHPRRGDPDISGNWAPNEAATGLVPDAEDPPQYYHINKDDRISPPGEVEEGARLPVRVLVLRGTDEHGA